MAEVESFHADRLKKQRAIEGAIENFTETQDQLVKHESVLLDQIKKLVIRDRFDAAKVVAKELVLVRRNIVAFYKSCTELHNMLILLTTVESADEMKKVLRNSIQALITIGREQKMKVLPDVLAILADNSMLSESKDSVMKVDDDDDDEEEISHTIEQIKDEVAFDLSSRFPDLPRAPIL
jgi:hypothetical protein